MMDDYISRQKVERFIENGLNNPDKKKAFGHDAIEILTEVHYMEPADVRPVVRGHWIPYKLGDMKCSNCGGVYGVCAGLLEDYNYCPRCGADMRDD